jgi:hypothetical protein
MAKFKIPGEHKHRGALILFVLIIIIIIYLLWRYPGIIDYVKSLLKI